MMGIDHPAGHRFDHLETGCTHGNIFVPDSFIQAVSDGSGGVEASGHPLISGNKLVGRYIQNREVLAGKRKLAVFSNRAASEGNPWETLLYSLLVHPFCHLIVGRPDGCI